jgi:hypothetical protein
MIDRGRFGIGPGMGYYEPATPHGGYGIPKFHPIDGKAIDNNVQSRDTIKEVSDARI